MRLIGKKPPQKWPIKVFWILVAIHLPIIVLMILTSIVNGTILAMIEFWFTEVPLFVLSLLLDPIKAISAVIAAYLIWYLCRFDWPDLSFLFTGQRPSATDNFVRGRRVLNSNALRDRILRNGLTLQGKVRKDPNRKPIPPRMPRRNP